MNREIMVTLNEFIIGHGTSLKTKTDIINFFCKKWNVSYSTAYKWIADGKHFVVNADDNELLIVEVKRSIHKK